MAAAAFGRPVVLAASADTLTKVQSIIAEQLGTDTGAVGAEKKFADLGADSLDTVEIMMALEEQFDISIDEEGELLCFSMSRVSWSGVISLRFV